MGAEVAQVPAQRCEARPDLGVLSCTLQAVRHLARVGDPSWHLLGPPSPCHVPATTASSSPVPQGSLPMGDHHVGQRDHHEGVSRPDMKVVWFHGKLKEKENHLVFLTYPAQLP